ncbi:MAG: hypothetical protein ABIW76_05390 [Fibrobacteria bacterium]
MRKLFGCCLLLLPAFAYPVPRITYITAGPMLHFNSRNSEIHVSWGFEVSAWSYQGAYGGVGLFSQDSSLYPDIKKRGYGLDVGFDYENGKFRLYCEPQISWYMVGLSLGPVYEIRKGPESPRFGLQGSVWPLWLPVVDYRFREVSDEFYVSPGLYLKLPVFIAK